MGEVRNGRKKKERHYKDYWSVMVVYAMRLVLRYGGT